jgi:hypothetical protein
VVRTAKYLITVRAALPAYVSVMVVIGLLPVPGPFDEVVLATAMVIMLARHHHLVRVCWEAAKLEEV